MAEREREYDRGRESMVQGKSMAERQAVREKIPAWVMETGVREQLATSQGDVSLKADSRVYTGADDLYGGTSPASPHPPPLLTYSRSITLPTSLAHVFHFISLSKHLSGCYSCHAADNLVVDHQVLCSLTLPHTVPSLLIAIPPHTKHQYLLSETFWTFRGTWRTF